MLRAKIAAACGIDEKNLPASYQIVGDVLLMKASKLSPAEKKKAAAAILRILPRIKTICEIRGIGGALRKPRTAKLAGNGTETVHTEHGIRYALDVRKIMFSKGNEHERHRIVSGVKNNETVVDMFAGIGYFSLPVSRRAKNLIAIEKNPVAYRYLRKNIGLNKAHNIAATKGDCRTVAKRFANTADRIIMGYLPKTEKFLPAALCMAKSGCIIHFHNTCHKNNTHILEEQVKKACRQHGCAFRILKLRKVKDYAPNVCHMVLDFELSKD